MFSYKGDEDDAINTVEDIQEGLERAISEAGREHIDARIGPRQGGNLELRVESGGEKFIFPIRWVTTPSRALFADEGKRRDFKGVLAAPRIADGLARDLRQWGIPHLDLDGRLFLIAAGLLVDTEPRRRSKRVFISHSSPVAEPEIFAPKASRLVRVLLTERDRSWTQAELVKATKNSRAYTSRVLVELVRNGYVAKDEGSWPHSYRLIEFDRLLDDWVEADEFGKRVEIVEYSLLENDPLNIARDVRDALGPEGVVFTQWCAAWLRHPYTTPSIVSAYVHPNVPRRFHLGRQVDSGGNLWLLLPKDKGVFQSAQQAQDFPLVSDVQIYLDLVQAGLRGPEAAQALRNWDGFGQ